MRNEIQHTLQVREVKRKTQFFPQVRDMKYTRLVSGIKIIIITGYTHRWAF
jgi:hypothetical protein